MFEFQIHNLLQPTMTQKLVELHLVLIPFMALGHLLPMVDIAKLLARRNVAKVTLATTPLNAVRVRASIDREIHQSGSPINLHIFHFPNEEGRCESLVNVSSMDDLTSFQNFLCTTLQDPLEELFEKLSPTPSCIIYDPNVPSVAAVAEKFQVPAIIFDGTNCFNLFCNHSLRTSKVYEDVSDSEPFTVPGLPDRVVFKKHQIHPFFNIHTDMVTFRDKVWEAAEEAYGVIVNSFEELEEEYVKEYTRVTGRKVWCIGPVSLSNKDDMDKAKRGKPDIKEEEEEEEEEEEGEYLKWLDSWPARSVIYVCLGSLNRVPPEQLMELGLGVEATKRPFIWVLRDSEQREEMEKILKEDGLEERVKARGLIIRGWVPQVLILSHTGIGAFLTHCGWNSTLEGICSGVPLITFPLFADQFYNEKVVVELLGIGVRVGVENCVNFWDIEEDKNGVQVKGENVKEAIEKVMGVEDEESESTRERARKYAEKAKKAMEKDGSSFCNMSLLIEDITHHVKGLKFNEAN